MYLIARKLRFERTQNNFLSSLNFALIPTWTNTHTDTHTHTHTRTQTERARFLLSKFAHYATEPLLNLLMNNNTDIE